MTETMWMVRAGREADHLDDFIESGHVAIGFAREIGEVPTDITKKDLTARMREAHPEWKDGKVTGSASQLFRFFSEI